MTIHNLGYQGVFAGTLSADTGLDGFLHWLDHGERMVGRVNLLREGIVHAHHVTTVSPTYAREIQTPEYGWGLDGVLRSRAGQLTGILNGVDYEEWDPRRDPYLPIHFGPKELERKADLKRNFLLRQNMRPTHGRVPLFGIVSRLAAQKGFDLLADTLPKLLADQDVRVAAVGTGDPKYETFFAGLAQKYRSRVFFLAGYDESLAHWIEGASDAFLMPSLYEPCGLNQMYSLRYGTIPIVRRTGGLADSVQHFDPETGQGTGIVFNDFDATAMSWALNTATQWYSNAALWQTLVQNAMRQDFSWTTQANEYLKLFAQLLQLDAAALIERNPAKKTAG
jgi:starch synthase